MKLNLGLFLTRRALLEPEKTAVIDPACQPVTFQQLDARTNRLAHGLIRLGVEPGDRVGLLLANGVEFLECFFALAKIGAIVAPINFRLAPPEIEYIIEDCGLRTLIYGAEFASLLEAVIPRVAVREFICVGGSDAQGRQGMISYDALLAESPSAEPDQPLAHARGTVPNIRGAGDDPLLIMYTSGTTGRPKGAVMTHRHLFWASASLMFTLDYRPEDRILLALPLYHIGALIQAVFHVHKGLTSVLMRSFDPVKMLETIERERVTIFLAVAPMLQAMLPALEGQSCDLSSLRWVMAGAAPVPVSLIHAYLRLGVRIQQVYGTTENIGPGAIIGPEKAAEKVGSAGLPFFHLDLKLVAESGNPVKAGEVGEILLRGPHVINEYWNNPDATAETIRDGWLHTGDLGRQDEDGYLTIVDRKKDMIISGGENIYPAEVESVLCAHPKIAEVAVIGQPDEKWGESPCAVVVVKPGQSLTAGEVIDFCQGRLARYKIPKRAVFSDAPLPRGATGKVLKPVLREKFGRGEK